MTPPSASREIVVESSPEETRVVVLENGKPAEIHVERPDERSLVGNVYLGRVDRVIPGMQSAFIDVGLARHAFLHVSDVLPGGADGEPPAEEKPIETLLRNGQQIIVQVSREPIASKGARVTADVTLAGKLVVYMPLTSHLGISKRIADPAQREELRAAVEAVRGRVEGGAIVRTDALGAPDGAIEAELLSLQEAWRAIQAGARGATAPKLLREEEGIAFRLLRDAQAKGVQRVLTDDADLLARLRAWAEAHSPGLQDRLELRTGEGGLLESLGLEQEIDKAVRDRAWLKSGGYLVINQLEALVAIDVNTGKFVGGRRLEETILQVNLEAAREVARQLRLRDLGGIVVVDFIDMEEEAHRRALRDELESAFARDRAKTTVLAMSDFGLVQITRQRQKNSLDRTLLQPCPACSGSGRVKSAETLANAVMRRLRREQPGTAVVRAHPEVAELVRRKARAAGLRAEVVEDVALARESWEVAPGRPASSVPVDGNRERT